jgi:hypothetical protein
MRKLIKAQRSSFVRRADLASKPDVQMVESEETLRKRDENWKTAHVDERWYVESVLRATKPSK